MTRFGRVRPRPSVSAGNAGPEPGARMAVVIPVGPREPVANVADTLDSVRHHARPGTAAVVVNDGARPEVADLARAFDLPVDVIDEPGPGSGVAGGLSRLTCLGLRRALELPGVDLVLRLDSDALFIGPGLEDRARHEFARDPTIGLLGSHTHLSTGQQRDFGPAAWMLRRDLGERRRHRLMWSVNLRRTLRAARRNGYRDGDHVLAAASVFSGECVRRLRRAGLLPPIGIRDSLLPDDQFLGLAVRAVGLRLGDFATGELPVAVSWHGLPDTPDNLLRTRKAVVHSVKTWGTQDGNAVRERFRQERRRRASTSS